MFANKRIKSKRFKSERFGNYRTEPICRSQGKSRIFFSSFCTNIFWQFFLKRLTCKQLLLKQSTDQSLICKQLHFQLLISQQFKNQKFETQQSCPLLPNFGNSTKKIFSILHKDQRCFIPKIVQDDKI